MAVTRSTVDELVASARSKSSMGDLYNAERNLGPRSQAAIQVQPKYENLQETIAELCKNLDLYETSIGYYDFSIRRTVERSESSKRN